MPDAGAGHGIFETPFAEEVVDGEDEEVSEICFPRDTGFRKERMTAESFSHPAKLDSQLLLWLVEKYTHEGETILDPMGGSGTALLACPLGRHVILVELEAKFVAMQEANWQKIQTWGPQMGYQMGSARIIHGDARELSGLLADSIITSPPYGDTLREGHHSPAADRLFLDKGLGTYTDAIVTSPPYEGSIQGKPGIDWSKMDGGKRDMTKEGAQATRIASLSGYTDAVITSPPYADSVSRFRDREGEQEHLRELGIRSSPNSMLNQESQYSGASDNIGNLKGESYLSAMKAVYAECFKVLKPGGIMVLILKNFIRNQQIVPLDLDTQKLCEVCGFLFLERHYRKLPGQSFWRILYRRKYPDAPVIDTEDVLVFRK